MKLLKHEIDTATGRRDDPFLDPRARGAQFFGNLGVKKPGDGTGGLPLERVGGQIDRILEPASSALREITAGTRAAFGDCADGAREGVADLE